MTTQSVLGESIKRREDPRLITGRGTYVDDVRLVGMLNMVLVRSPHAHANIRSVDTSAAESADGVVCRLYWPAARRRARFTNLWLGGSRH